MSDDSRISFLFNVLVPPIFFYAAVLALWDNEGRFDYHAAAKDTRPIKSLASAAEGSTVSYTNSLNTDPIEGYYVKDIYGFYVVERSAEIYAWEYCDDDSLSLCLEWSSYLEYNSRNNGVSQVMESADLYPSYYELNDLYIDGDELHFSDAYEDIPTSDLTLNHRGLSQNLVSQGDYYYLYKGRDDYLGDERIRYEGIALESRATFFGLIDGDEAVLKQYDIKQTFFSRFNISAMILNDGVIYHLVNGNREVALATIKMHMKNLMWKVRFIGIGVICLAIYWFFSAFTSLVFNIPLLGDVVTTSVLVVSLIIGVPIGISVILVSMVVHHPFVVGLPLLLVVVAVMKLRKHKAASKKNVRKTLAKVSERPKADSMPVSHLNSATNETTLPVESEFINLIKLALSDRVLHKREKSFFVRCGKNKGIKKERMLALFEEAKQDLNPIHVDSKDSFIVLICLAMADGLMSKNELFILQNVGKRLGLAVGEVMSLIKGVEDGSIAERI